MRKHRITAVLVVLAMAIGLTGCTTFDNFKNAFFEGSETDDVTVKIGIYEPLSGADSEAAEAEVSGIELANEVYPTVGGKVVQFIYSDNSSDIYAAETAISNLVSKDPDIILGSYNSVYSLIAGEAIHEAEIPAIAMTNMNPLITKNNPYYFRVCYVDSTQGDLLAKYVLTERKEKTAGVMIPVGDDAALATTTAFKDRMEAETENNEAVTPYESYEPDQEDFSEQLENIRESGVKSVLLPGDIDDAARIINQADKMGLDVAFLGDNDWSKNEFRELLDSSVDMENIYFINFFAGDGTKNEEAEKFLKAYHEKYGENKEPSEEVALGYDAYLVALEAVERAGDDMSGKAIREVLAGSTEFSGVSGKIIFNNTGDPIRGSFVSRWDGDEIVSVHKVIK